MLRLHLFILGDVTGVGYRMWAKRQADHMGISGWVRNADDETVELVAEGPKEKLEEMIVRAKKGPEIAWVKDVQVRWEDMNEGFAGFEIRT